MSEDEILFDFPYPSEFHRNIKSFEHCHADWMVRLSRDPDSIYTSLDDEEHARVTQCMSEAEREYARGNIEVAWCLLLMAAREISYSDGLQEVAYENSVREMQRGYGRAGGEKRASNSKKKLMDIGRRLLLIHETSPFTSRLEMEDRAYKLSEEEYGSSMGDNWLVRFLSQSHPEVKSLHESLPKP